MDGAAIIHQHSLIPPDVNNGQGGGSIGASADGSRQSFTALQSTEGQVPSAAHFAPSLNAVQTYPSAYQQYYGLPYTYASSNAPPQWAYAPPGIVVAHNAPPLITQQNPQQLPSGQRFLHHQWPDSESLSRIDQRVDTREDSRKRLHSEGQSFKVDDMIKVPNPPDLGQWRQRLFDLHEPIVMTEDEFVTYFPHVDNIYSHRSTQKLRKNLYAVHYWDCRLKGRPSGTQKSTDPRVKKRNRTSRELDQCNVKIKIVEIIPYSIIQVGSTAVCSTEPLSVQSKSHALSAEPSFGAFPPSVLPTSTASSVSLEDGLALPLTSAGGVSVIEANSRGRKIYVIQRIAAKDAGGTNEPDRHRHDLAYSDKIKKNSVVRETLKDEKEKKKVQKQYHKKTSGDALKTANAHASEHDLKLYGSCFCPFVQRVWISLEHKKIPYQYIEVDPYKKPKSLLDVNPRGLVPALRHGEWACHESTVIMEYLEDLDVGTPLMPPDAKGRANSRLWTDHVNRHIVPAFYHYLQAQETEKQAAEAETFKKHITTLVDAAAKPGPFFLGPQLSLVDVQLAPWIIRLNRVLKPYRGWPDPEPGSRWAAWVKAIEECEAIKATTSEDVLYLESYERYAENRPNTSQVADAVNKGRGLP